MGDILEAILERQDESWNNGMNKSPQGDFIKKPKRREIV